MRRFDQIKLYQITDRIRWVNEGKPIALLYFPENGSFLKDLTKLKLQRRDFFYVVYPNMKFPRTRLVPNIIRAYRREKYIVYSTDMNLPDKNLIIDFSPYLSAIDARIKPGNYRKRAGFLIKSAMEELFALVPNHRKVLLYSIDVSKQDNIPSFINRKLFLTIKELNNAEYLPFDDLFMVIFDGKTIYRPLVLNKEFKFNRTLFYFRNIFSRGTFGEKETEELSTNIVNKAIPEKKMPPEKIFTLDMEKSSKRKRESERDSQEEVDKREKLKDAVKHYLKNSPKKTEEFVANEPSRDVSKRVAVAATIYRATGDLMKANHVARKIPREKLDKSIEVIHKELLDEILPPQEIEILTEDPILKGIKIDKQVDNKQPKHLFTKRKIDFEINLEKDMVNAFKVLSTKSRDIPIYLEELKIEIPSPKSGELLPTDRSILKAKLRDSFGNIHNIELDFPNIREDGTFRIYGKRKCLVNQIILCPISFLKPYMAKFESSFATFSIWSKRLRSGNRLRIYIGSLKLSLMLILAYRFGFDETMELYGIDYEISKEKPKKEAFFVQLQDKTFLIFKNIDSELKLELCNSFIKENLHLVPTNKEFGTKEYFADIILGLTNQTHSLFLIDNVCENIVDPIVRQVLVNQDLPTDLENIIKYMAEGVVQGRVQKRNDLQNQRIRNSEVLVYLAQKAILAAYTTYREQVLAGNKNAKLNINTNAIMKEFIKTELVMDMEYSNPIEEMSFITRVSPIGKQVGGIPSRMAIQIEARNVDDTYFGNIDPLDTPEGQNIGITQQLAIGASISTSRGLFAKKEMKNEERAGVLSTSSCFTPFVECNDGVRIIMAANQSRQMLPLQNPENPIVQTGYETILTDVLSDNFVKRSPVDGRVVEVANDFIKILGDDGKTYMVDITMRDLRSGAGKNTLSIFSPTEEILSNDTKTIRVKKGQLLAEGACMKNGVISMGRNLLTAIMPYQGYNFEDGIVLSEAVSQENKLTSLHLLIEDVELLEGDKITYIAKIGSETKRGDVILKKKIGELERLFDIGIDSEEENEEIVFGELVKKSSGGKIVDIEFFDNEYKEYPPEIEALKARTDRKYGRRNKEKYKMNDKPINTLVRFKIQQKLPIVLGDKLCNRHGNKGIVSRIVPAEEMPRAPWGEPVEIILNPLGIINRMNMGQLYELYCGLIGKKLASLILTKKDKRFTIEILKKVFSILQPETYEDLIDTVKNYDEHSFRRMLEYLSKNKFFPIVVPPFKSPKNTNIKKVLEILQLRSGYKLLLPGFPGHGRTRKEVPVGYMYIAKLEHLADSKMHVRSTGPVVRKFNQPTQGKRREGGQRVGELDTWSLASYNAIIVLQELMGSLSDDAISKNEMVAEIIERGHTEFKNIKSNPTRDLLNAYFAAMMLERR